MDSAYCSIFVLGINSIINDAKDLKEIRKKEDKCESLIGKEVSIGRDTFTIIDYTRSDNTFTLSNGAKVQDDVVLTKFKHEKDRH